MTERKKVTITFEVTEEEKKHLTARGKKLGLIPSHFCKMLAFKHMDDKD